MRCSSHSVVHCYALDVAQTSFGLNNRLVFFVSKGFPIAVRDIQKDLKRIDPFFVR